MNNRGVDLGGQAGVAGIWFPLLFFHNRKTPFDKHLTARYGDN
jgi:hypothetical protein